jgi:cobalt/nickel transport protein
MNHPSKAQKNLKFAFVGLGISLLVAIFVSPFASQNPDGLDRVAQDLQFDTKAQEEPIAKQLPFAIAFEEYALRGVPEAVATPLAGLVGTIATFGLAWGLGKLTIRQRRSEPPIDADPIDADQRD